MPRLQSKSFKRPDGVRALGQGRLELVNLDETTVGRVMLPAGRSWSKDVRPVVATSSADWWLIVVRITKVGGVSDAV